MNKWILFLTVLLCFASCNKEEIQAEQSSWVGTWLVKSVVLNDTLQEIPVLPQGAYWNYITLMIPEGDSGIVTGNTFKNGIGFDFNLVSNNKVEFGDIGGTRAGEDEWGLAFNDNIRKTTSYEVEKDSLYFKGIDSNLLVIFTKPK